MDALARRAADLYLALLRDDRALAEEVETALEERFRAAGLTFGGRALCPFAMPQFVSRADYDRVRATARAIYGAIVKAWRALGPALHDAVGLAPEERELVSLDPGYESPSPLSRLDSFLGAGEYRFVEMNAETPAGLGYSEVLSDVFERLGVMREFAKRFALHRPAPAAKLLETLVACYRHAGGRAEKPVIAVVDYDDVPTRTEHHILAAFFRARGHEALVCDPRTMTFDGGALRQDGRAVDVVYKRLLVNELLEQAEAVRPLVDAARARACVFVNPFACKPIHKKAIFAILTDDAHASLFSPAERAEIAAHVPWTRLMREGPATRNGATVDLVDWTRENRERLVLKPNDEYGGKGVFLGFESSVTEWDRAIDAALRAPTVVQEKVEIAHQPFPQIGPGLPVKDYVVDLDPFLFFGEVEGFLTRLSASSLANVTSGGGQTPAFVVEGEAAE